MHAKVITMKKNHMRTQKPANKTIERHFAVHLRINLIKSNIFFRSHTLRHWINNVHINCSEMRVLNYLRDTMHLNMQCALKPTKCSEFVFYLI